MRVAIRRVDPSLPLPEYQSAGAVAFDLYARTDTTVGPGAIARIPSNLIVAVPEGHALVVALRSGTPGRLGLLMPNAIGIIDQDFRGPADEIEIQVYNFTREAVTVERGARFAQALLVPVARCEWMEHDPAVHASRGGFGSTGTT